MLQHRVTMLYCYSKCYSKFCYLILAREPTWITTWVRQCRACRTPYGLRHAIHCRTHMSAPWSLLLAWRRTLGWLQYFTHSLKIENTYEIVVLARLNHQSYHGPETTNDTILWNKIVKKPLTPCYCPPWRTAATCVTITWPRWVFIELGWLTLTD